MKTLLTICLLSLASCSFTLKREASRDPELEKIVANHDQVLRQIVEKFNEAAKEKPKG